MFAYFSYHNNVYSHVKYILVREFYQFALVYLDSNQYANLIHTKSWLFFRDSSRIVSDDVGDKHRSNDQQVHTERTTHPHPTREETLPRSAPGVIENEYNHVPAYYFLSFHATASAIFTFIIFLAKYPGSDETSCKEDRSENRHFGVTFALLFS